MEIGIQLRVRVASHCFLPVCGLLYVVFNTGRMGSLTLDTPGDGTAGKIDTWTSNWFIPLLAKEGWPSPYEASNRA